MLYTSYLAYTVFSIVLLKYVIHSETNYQVASCLLDIHLEDQELFSKPNLQTFQTLNITRSNLSSRFPKAFLNFWNTSYAPLVSMTKKVSDCPTL